MASNEGRRRVISISQQTKDALDSVKHAGQSYNGLTQELVKFWKEQKGPVQRESVKVGKR